MRTGITKTISVMVLTMIIIGLIFASYMLYAYDYVGNCSQIVSVFTFLLQCVMNVGIAILLGILHNKVN